MATTNEAQVKIYKHLSSLVSYLAGDEADEESSDEFAQIIMEALSLEVKEVHADGSFTVTVSMNSNFASL